MFYKHRNECRGCRSKNLAEILDLGSMPLAGGFIDSSDKSEEIIIPLKVHFCKDCKLVQILDVVNPEILFKNYKYVSSVIPSLQKHFIDYSVFLKKNYLKSGGKILEFGCNDGVLLKNFNGSNKIVALGIDPSENICHLAAKNGCRVINGYFDQNNARKILSSYGPMDVVTGSNVFAHSDNIREIIKAAKIILKPDGVFIIEVHYLKDLVSKLQYDTIYHEHLCYYSVTSLKNILSLEQLKIINVKHLKMHGGAIRVTASLNSSKRIADKSVDRFLTNEKHLNNQDELIRFGKKCQTHKEKLTKLLKSLKNQNKTIVGYGAPGRGTILLNYCCIDNKILDYIVDISPLRSGKLMPGVRIPICYPDVARQQKPDYFLLLAWNYKDSILDQEKEMLAAGVKFIIPFPKIKIL